MLNRKTGRSATWAVKEAATHTTDGLLREASALSRIHTANAGQAPHVVPLVGIVARHHPTCTSPNTSPLTTALTGPILRTGHVQALLMPVFESGDLFTFLQRPECKITATARWRIVEQIIAGLIAAKAAGVAHCDVKPHNVLRHSSGDVYITDFGLSVSSVTAGTQCSRAHGSPLYMAPEALACLHGQNGGGTRPYHPHPADVWSLGITMTQVALPRLWRACLRGARHSPGGWPEVRDRVLAAVKRVCEPRMVQLVSRALTLRPALRATLEELAAIAAVGAAEARAARAAAEATADVAAARVRLAGFYRGAGVAAAPGGGGRDRPLREDERFWQQEEVLARDAESLFPRVAPNSAPEPDSAGARVRATPRTLLLPDTLPHLVTTSRSPGTLPPGTVRNMHGPTVTCMSHSTTPGPPLRIVPLDHDSSYPCAAVCVLRQVLVVPLQRMAQVLCGPQSPLTSHGHTLRVISTMHAVRITRGCPAPHTAVPSLWHGECHAGTKHNGRCAG